MSPRAPFDMRTLVRDRMPVPGVVWRAIAGVPTRGLPLEGRVTGRQNDLVLLFEGRPVSVLVFLRAYEPVLADLAHDPTEQSIVRANVRTIALSDPTPEYPTTFENAWQGTTEEERQAQMICSAGYVCGDHQREEWRPTELIRMAQRGRCRVCREPTLWYHLADEARTRDYLRGLRQHEPRTRSLGEMSSAVRALTAQLQRLRAHRALTASGRLTIAFVDCERETDLHRHVADVAAAGGRVLSSRLDDDDFETCHAVVEIAGDVADFLRRFGATAAGGRARIDAWKPGARGEPPRSRARPRVVQLALAADTFLAPDAFDAGTEAVLREIAWRSPDDDERAAFGPDDEDLWVSPPLPETEARGARATIRARELTRPLGFRERDLTGGYLFGRTFASDRLDHSRTLTLERRTQPGSERVERLIAIPRDDTRKQLARYGGPFAVREEDPWAMT